MRKKDPKFIAQLYLLSASEILWIRSKQVMCLPGFIDYSLVDGVCAWTFKGDSR